MINNLDIDDMFTHLATLAEEVDSNDEQAIQSVIKRWKCLFQNGTFKLTTPTDAKIGQNVPLANFWTGPLDFRNMPTQDPSLFKELQQSDLVVFKVC